MITEVRVGDVFGVKDTGAVRTVVAVEGWKITTRRDDGVKGYWTLYQINTRLGEGRWHIVMQNRPEWEVSEGL